MYRFIYFFLLLVLFSCFNEETDPPKKYWLGKEVDFNNIVPVLNQYHMFDSTGTKVGSMAFGLEFQNEQLVAIDTSQFDDGSIYETARFFLDTSDFTLNRAAIDLSMGPTRLQVSLEQADKRIKGIYEISRDTSVLRQQIDSVYTHDIFRSEIYMLLHAFRFNKNDSLQLRALVPTSMRVSDAAMTYEGEEVVEVPAGRFSCDVVWLKTDGGMPDNKVWIRKTVPRRMVKFFVPDIGLSIELVKSKDL